MHMLLPAFSVGWAVWWSYLSFSLCQSDVENPAANSENNCDLLSATWNNVESENEWQNILWCCFVNAAHEKNHHQEERQSFLFLSVNVSIDEWYQPVQYYIFWAWQWVKYGDALMLSSRIWSIFQITNNYLRIAAYQWHSVNKSLAFCQSW